MSTLYYLRADTEQAMDAALYEAGLLTVIFGALWPIEGVSVFRIGKMSFVRGYDPLIDGEATPRAIVETAPGYHANLMSDEPLTDDQVGRLPIVPAPDNPVFTFS